MIYSISEKLNNIDPNELNSILAKKTVYRLPDTKLSVILDKQFINPSIDQKSLCVRPEYNPLKEINTNREFILYLTAASNTGSGKPAAWISAYYHLIPFVSKKYANKKIMLLDTMSDFNKFSKQRLRTDTLISRHLDKIKIESWQDFQINKEIPEIDQSYDIYIVSGWYLLKKMYDRNDVIEKENELISNLPEGSTIIWIDTPEADVPFSYIYQRRTIIPFAEDHPRSNYVTKIIYNLPVAPKTLMHKNPQYVDYRIILAQNKKRIYFRDVISVPPLRRYSSKFYGKYNKKKIQKKPSIKYDTEFRNELIHKSFHLLPWLAKLDKKKLSTFDIDHYLDLENEIIRDNSFVKYDRLTYNKNLIYTKRRDSYHTKENINTPYRSRSHSVKFVKPNKTTIKPLNPAYLLAPKLKKNDRKKAEERERRMILSILNQFKKQIIVRDNKTMALFDTLDIFDMIKKSVINNLPVEIISGKLRQWDATTYDQIWLSLEEIRIKLYTKFFKYNSNITIQEKEKYDEQLFFNFGNAIYLCMLGIKQMYPNIPNKALVHLWRHYFPYVLQIIGFKDNYPQNLKIARSSFNARLFWINLKTKARYWVKEIIPKYHEKQLTDVRQGYIIYMDDFSWLVLENHQIGTNDVALLHTSNSSIRPSTNPFKATTRPDYINSCQDIYQNQAASILVGKLKGRDYLWYFTDKWNLVGEVSIIYQENLQIIDSIQINKTDIKNIQINIEPEGIEYDAIRSHTKEISKITQVVAKIDYDEDVDEFKILYSDRDEKEKILWYEYFDLTRDLINRLNYFKYNLITENEDKIYRLDVYKDVDYGDMMILSAYVNSSARIVKYLDEGFPETASEAYSLAKDSANDMFSTIAEVPIGHSLVKCEIRDIPLSETIKDKPIMFKSSFERKMSPSDVAHGACYYFGGPYKDLFDRIYKKEFFTSREIQFIVRKGVIEDFSNVYRLNVIFETEEPIRGQEVVQRSLLEDNTMRWLIYEVTGQFLTLIDPNASQIEEMYYLSNINQEIGRGYALYITCNNVSTGKRFIHTIESSSNVHIRYRSWKSELEGFYKKYKDKLDEEFGESFEVLSKEFMDQAIRHIKNCDICQLDDSEDNRVIDLASFEIEDLKVFMVGEQINPSQMEIYEEWSLPKADDNYELLQFLKSIAYQIISDRIIPDVFDTSFDQDIVEVAAYFTDPIIEIQAIIEDQLDSDEHQEIDQLLDRLNKMNDEFEDTEGSRFDEYEKIIENYHQGNYRAVVNQSENFVTSLKLENNLYSNIYAIQALYLQARAHANLGEFKLSLEKLSLAESTLLDIPIDLCITNALATQRSEGGKFHERNIIDHATLLREKGYTYLNCNDLDDSTANKYFKDALKMGKISNIEDKAELYKGMGIAYYRSGDLDRALTHCQESLSLHQKINQNKFSNQLVLVNQNIALIYRKKRNFARSLQINLQILKYCEKQENQILILNSLDQIARDYHLIGDFNKSMKYHKAGFSLIKNKLQNISSARIANKLYYTLNLLLDQMEKLDTNQRIDHYLDFAIYEKKLKIILKENPSSNNIGVQYKLIQARERCIIGLLPSYNSNGIYKKILVISDINPMYKITAGLCLCNGLIDMIQELGKQYVKTSEIKELFIYLQALAENKNSIELSVAIYRLQYYISLNFNQFDKAIKYLRKADLLSMKLPNLCIKLKKDKIELSDKIFSDFNQDWEIPKEIIENKIKIVMHNLLY